MSCTQTLAGIARDCSPNMGGIKRALLANHEDVTAVTVSSNQVTAITMESGKKYKPYNFKPETSTFNTTLNKNIQSGSLYYATEIALQFPHLETAKSIELDAVDKAELSVIIEDNNGKFWLFGKDEPVMSTAGTDAPGTARGDANGYNLTLLDNSLQRPLEVDPDIIDALIG